MLGHDTGAFQVGEDHLCHGGVVVDHENSGHF
jgi:hypothetical protein